MRSQPFLAPIERLFPPSPLPGTQAQRMPAGAPGTGPARPAPRAAAGSPAGGRLGRGAGEGAVLGFAGLRDAEHPLGSAPAPFPLPK